MSFKALTKENVKDFKNFGYNEFTCKCGGKYCNGDPAKFSYVLAEHLQKIRDHFGKPLVITSGLRCDKWNSLQKNADPNSRHKRGIAVDFYINGVTYNQLANYVKKLPYFRYCYRVIKDQNVIHYDIIPPEIDTPTKTTTYTVKFGDTLSKIAKEYKTTVSELIALNKAKYPLIASSKGNYIRTGWTLVVKK